MRLLISDANILIDMEEGRLITRFFQLPYEFCVPDILFYEELEDQHAYLCKLGLGLRELSADSLAQVVLIKGKYVGPSTIDIFALSLAKQESCSLVSGDKDLREAAETERIEVKGTIWLVEELVRHGFIDNDQAISAYEKMKAAGRRLPGAEVKRRLGRL